MYKRFQIFWPTQTPKRYLSFKRLLKTRLLCDYFYTLLVKEMSQIKNVVIVGAGLMGSGIAQVYKIKLFET